MNYLRETLRCDGSAAAGSCGSDTTKSGQRVSVFSANGSHANYPRPCAEDFSPCFQSKLEGEPGGVPERGHDGARPWGANAVSGALKPFPLAYGWASPSTANWTDWPGRWGLKGTNVGEGPASPALQPQYSAPWDSKCAESTQPFAFVCPNEARAATAKRVRQKPFAATSKARNAASADCASWFGADVRALVCDEAALARAIDQRRLGVKAQSKLPGLSGVAASAPGITQVIGSPLESGDSIDVKPTADAAAEIFLRIRGRQAGQVLVSKFGKGLAKGRSKIAVSPSGSPSLLQAGRVIAPQSVTQEASK